MDPKIRRRVIKQFIITKKRLFSVTRVEEITTRRPQSTFTEYQTKKLITTDVYTTMMYYTVIKIIRMPKHLYSRSDFIATFHSNPSLLTSPHTYKGT